MRKILRATLTFIVLFGLTACGMKTSTWQEQYDLGVRYLSEGNYEEAIIAFTAAIEIDPKNKDAFLTRGDSYISASSVLSGDEQMDYLTMAKDDYMAAIDLGENQASIYIKIADIYIQLGDTDAAIDILWRGYDSTGDETLFERADAIESYLLPMVSKVELYSPEGTLVEVIEAQYDDKRRLVRTDSRSFYPTYSATFWETWEYDEGNETTTYTYCSDDPYREEQPESEVKAGTIGSYVTAVVGITEVSGNVIVYDPFWESLSGSEEIDGVIFSDNMISTEIEWDHAVYDYNDKGLVSAISTYDEKGNLLGYAELEYMESY